MAETAPNRPIEELPNLHIETAAERIQRIIDEMNLMERMMRDDQ